MVPAQENAPPEPPVSQEAGHRIGSRSVLLGPPVAIAANATRVVGSAGSAVWVHDEDFEVLPDAPIGDIDYVGWIGGDIVVWSSQDGAAAIYDENSGDWNRYDGSNFGQPRVGSSVCADDAYLYVWGGWTDREVAYVASDSGASLGRR